MIGEGTQFSIEKTYAQLLHPRRPRHPIVRDKRLYFLSNDCSYSHWYTGRSVWQQYTIGDTHTTRLGLVIYPHIYQYMISVMYWFPYCIFSFMFSNIPQFFHIVCLFHNWFDMPWLVHAMGISSIELNSSHPSCLHRAILKLVSALKQFYGRVGIC